MYPKSGWRVGPISPVPEAAKRQMIVVNKQSAAECLLGFVLTTGRVAIPNAHCRRYDFTIARPMQETLAFRSKGSIGVCQTLRGERVRANRPFGFDRSGGSS
jgi:hypothetical protein